MKDLELMGCHLGAGWHLRSGLAYSVERMGFAVLALGSGHCAHRRRSPHRRQRRLSPLKLPGMPLRRRRYVAVQTDVTGGTDAKAKPASTNIKIRATSLSVNVANAAAAAMAASSSPQLMAKVFRMEFRHAGDRFKRVKGTQRPALWQVVLTQLQAKRCTACRPSGHSGLS